MTLQCLNHVLSVAANEFPWLRAGDRTLGRCVYVVNVGLAVRKCAVLSAFILLIQTLALKKMPTFCDPGMLASILS